MQQSTTTEHHDADVPNLEPGVDVRRLPIAPEDAFVLSRIDGRATVREIHLSTGLPLPRVVEALSTLARLGALRGANVPTPGSASMRQTASAQQTARAPVAQQAPPSVTQPAASQASVASQAASAASQAASAASQASVAAQPTHRAGTSNASKQDDASPLSNLDVMVSRIETDDHYRLLGVGRDAEKKAIKAAYFALVSNYHPDKYYGRELGDAKPKLERVFQALTSAHETLTRSKSRAAYDETLGPEQAVAGPADAPVSEATPVSSSARGSVSLIPPTKRSAGNLTHKAPQVGVAPPPPSSRGRVDAVDSSVVSRPRRAPDPPTPPRTPLRSANLGQSSRASVARKLSGMNGVNGSPRTAHSAGSPPAGTAMMAGSPELEHALRKLASMGPRAGRNEVPADGSAASRLTGIGAQAQRHVEEAEAHLMNGNPVASMNSLRLAATILPNDPEIRQKLKEAELQADVIMADSHLNNARQHERSGEWRQAGDFYARAARGRASGELYAQAAQCYRKDPGVLRSACDQAKLAVAHNPTDASAHRLLAEIYAEAGMRQSAIASLEKAASQFPKDDAIHTLLTRLKGDSS